MPRTSRLAGGAVIAVVTALLAGSCSAPATAEPWAERPVVELAFDVSEDLDAVTGEQTVRFTPDEQVCELVFRAWPNQPTGAESGNALGLTDAAVDGSAVRPEFSSAGAPQDAPGTLIELPLEQCRDAGETVTAELDFELTLGEDAGGRVGHSPDEQIAWFATGFPLLAWVRDEGWVRDEAEDIPGETATSEDFELAELAVTAPEDYSVLGTGEQAGTASAGNGATEHRFTAEAVRNVAVTVGELDVVRRDIDGVDVHLAAPRSAEPEVPLSEWAEATAEQLDNLEDLLGSYPYENLWISVIPAQSSGIEFPTALQFGDTAAEDLDALLAHELAHQWFYSLVGNNQARHPWLDESFATFAEAIATGQHEQYTLDDVSPRLAGHLGAPMSFWAERGAGAYFEGVYTQGAAVLLEARSRAGAERFDAALREYIGDNAHEVAEPADVAAAFEDLPEVLELLREYGALDGED